MVPPSPRTSLETNITTQTAQPTAAMAETGANKTGKKPVGSRKMKPGWLVTPRYAHAFHSTRAANIRCRNLCARVWCMSNPGGSSAQFALYWDLLEEISKAVCPSHCFTG
jgi:hypothetical protein